MKELYNIEQRHLKSGCSNIKRIDNLLKDIQNRLGNMNMISDYNMKVHECLSEA